LKPQGELFEFILKEWLMIASASGLALTSFYTQHFPAYSKQEIQMLYFFGSSEEFVGNKRGFEPVTM